MDINGECWVAIHGFPQLESQTRFRFSFSPSSSAFLREGEGAIPSIDMILWRYNII